MKIFFITCDFFHLQILSHYTLESILTSMILTDNEEDKN